MAPEDLRYDKMNKIVLILNNSLKAMRSVEWYDFDINMVECNCCHEINEHSTDCKISLAIKQIEELLNK